MSKPTASAKLPTSIETAKLKAVFGKLRKANSAWTALYPGEREERQPVETLYGGAHLFKYDSIEKIGGLALKAFDEYAATPADLDAALGVGELAPVIHRRVRDKIQREAVEDFRIDFEDGFGSRPDAEEDATAAFAAQEVARGMREDTLSPYIGIRIKTFSEELKHRGIRTLDIFLTTLLKATKGQLPENFVVTLPKITVPAHVAALVELLEVLEKKHKLKKGALKLELMIEHTASLIAPDGSSNLPALAWAAKGRCTGAHFGTYDYTASCSITAAHQTMDHPACDFARSLMKVAYGGTGIWLSDGATNVMPVGPHKASPNGLLTEAQRRENREVVHRAWRLGYDHIRHSLRNGFYQGWDLHPAQLPIRYAACYAFFLEGLEAASARLKNFIEKAAQATLVGDVFDDAATGQGLLNYFLRALNCGAITEEEVLATGLTLEEVRWRSFTKILNERRKP
ncbi:MAG: phosphoenolpyruvate kinase [Bacteriovoracia bacterium]